MKRTKKRAGRPTNYDSALAKWILRKDKSRDMVASDLEITRPYLDKLCRGAQGPGADLIIKIHEYTMGEVTATDLRQHSVRNASTPPRKK